MAKMVSGAIGLLVLIALAGGTGWAQQREVRLLRGQMSPMIEQPTMVACTDIQTKRCQDAGRESCTHHCGGGPSATCDLCQDAYTKSCMWGSCSK